MHRLVDGIRWKQKERRDKRDGFQETAGQVLSSYVQILKDELQMELDYQGHLMPLLGAWQRIKELIDQLDKNASALAELDSFLYAHWADLEDVLNTDSPLELEFKKCQQARREMHQRVKRFQKMDKPKRNTQKLKRKEKLPPLPLPIEKPLDYLAVLQTYHSFQEHMMSFPRFFSVFLETVSEEKFPEIIAWWEKSQGFLSLAQNHPEYQLIPKTLYSALATRLKDILASNSGDVTFTRMASEMSAFVEQYQQIQVSGEGENEGVPVPKEIRDLFPYDETDQDKPDLR